jgi:hypothetical protein
MFVASVHICRSLLGTLLCGHDLDAIFGTRVRIKGFDMLIAAVHLNRSAMEC